MIFCFGRRFVHVSKRASVWLVFASAQGWVSRQRCVSTWAQLIIQTVSHHYQHSHTWNVQLHARFPSSHLALVSHKLYKSFRQTVLSTTSHSTPVYQHLGPDLVDWKLKTLGPWMHGLLFPVRSCPKQGHLFRVCVVHGSPHSGFRDHDALIHVRW